MMDLKDIIKWFIPCFHILLMRNKTMSLRWIFVCLFLFYNLCPSFAAKLTSDIDSRVNDVTKSFLVNFNSLSRKDHQKDELERRDIGVYGESRIMEDNSIGRTFGRIRLRKMVSALLPLVFQMGAASTWAVVSAIVGFKTLLVALAILKLLLLAGAVKIGTLFGAKGHHTQGWEPHQKEVHLHIHNGQHGTYEHQEIPYGQHPTDDHVQIPYSSWNRDDNQPTSTVSNRKVEVNPLSVVPQIIRTPYGQYMKMDDSQTYRQQ